MADNETEGISQWAVAVTLTGLVVAVLSPYLGALADQGGLRRRFLMISTGICVTSIAVMFFPGEGQVVFARTVFTLSSIAFELGQLFYNAYLPDLAPPSAIGRVSGFGWGAEHIGGLLRLVMALFGFVQANAPLFGFSTEACEHVRATNLLVAIWVGLFALPLFLWTG
ncbi:MAG: MFS transporter [Bacteroidota bacterium]|nr:MFS transporter [Bacteroidota bacterium]